MNKQHNDDHASPQRRVVQTFDDETRTEWDELEQQDRCEHIEMVQWGSETLALHEAREIMNSFKTEVRRGMRAVVFGPMFRLPLRFLALWKFLFLVEPDTFIDIVESDPVSLGLMSGKQFERYQRFVKIAPKVLDEWPWEEIGKDLGLAKSTAEETFNSLIKEIRTFQFPPDNIEIAIINAAFAALAADIHRTTFDDSNRAVTKWLFEIARQEKAKAEVEFKAFMKESKPKI